MQTVPPLTEQQFDRIIHQCREIFLNKTKDYGTAWRVLRTISIADQLYIKAQRIRTIQETGKQKIEGDTIPSEFIGIVNYAVIGLIQMELPEEAPEELSLEEALHFYDKKVLEAKELMSAKNHDYGEAWRELSQQSFVDLILMKLQRMRQIVANNGLTLVSEGLDANYHDIINYAVFALILQSENKP